MWGRIAERDALLTDGDRVEIYRELLRDPREARRERARGA
ncbi:MAG: RnfH family protein [Pseudomonadota bacterium]